MKKWVFYLMLLPLSVVASVENYKTENYSTIKNIVEQYENTEKFIIFDIDDTLLSMPQSLGSAGWWDWQYNLLRTYQETGQMQEGQLALNETELERYQNILFSLSEMQPVEGGVLEFVNSLPKSDTIIALTARGNAHKYATLMQLKRSGFQRFYADFSWDKAESILDRNFFENGVYFANGKNKGELINALRKLIKKPKPRIIFVDDSKVNAQQVSKTFSSIPDVDITVIEYSHEHSRQDNIKYNQEEQNKILLQWDKLKSGVSSALGKTSF